MAKTLHQDAGVAEQAKNGSAIDIEAMINAFLADASRNSLELPRSLTAEQRKQAKRLAEQHQGLKCESYGYGQERQLHLFKKESKDCVRVKNTFIDDWEGSAGEEQAIFRSMPPSMPVDLLQRTLERCKVNSEGNWVEAPEHKDELASGESPSKAGQSVGSTSGPDLPPLPDGFQVRNTFIHIESVPEVERIVQSMPHGMFRQCLEAELSAQGPPANSTGSTANAVAASTPAAASPLAVSGSAAPQVTAPVAAPSASAPPVLAPGTEVVIQGLVKLPDFNGLRGVVQSLDEESGRYDVLLDGPAGQCGWRWVKVKGENCRPCMPPPPCTAPTISLDCVEDENAEEPTAVPPTPHWEEDFACQAALLEQKSNATPLKLNSLV
mmetsp:Transcript_61171/g.178790  ORF Transcript_61171/g.178790 Transcript_61171/m.178790 type:complete len:381 (+) Transcript_61171:101-1243(+)